MRPPVRSRGFTLVELLVGAAVGAVVLLGISLTFVSQAQQYQAHASRRGIQANARQALAFMGRIVRSAGYGVNPDRAILAYDSYDAAGDGPVAGYPDAFVVHWRDSLFRREVAAINGNRIDLRPVPVDPADPFPNPGLKEELLKGQILLVLCPLARNHAFVTVNTFTPVGALAVDMDPTPPLGAPNSPIDAPGRLFREQAKLAADPCFSTPGTQVVKINRAAFYVAAFDTDGVPATLDKTPYLMMHQGVDLSGEGTIDVNDAVPVAEGIEQLQVAYILNSNSNAPPLIRGVNELPMMPQATYYGEQWEQINPGALPPNWFFNPSIGFTHAMRTMDHPANIRQVRMTVVARSTVADRQIQGDNMLSNAQGAPLEDDAIPWRQLENLGVPGSPDFTPAPLDPPPPGIQGGFYRVLLRESITPKNLMMNSQFPPVSFTNDPLVGGG